MSFDTAPRVSLLLYHGTCYVVYYIYQPTLEREGEGLEEIDWRDRNLSRRRLLTGGEWSGVELTV